MTQGWQVSGKTHFVCLLGKPTAHSLSPAMHNLSFKLLGIDSIYTCFDVENENLGAVVAAFKALHNWDGFNLTMPCKKAIIPHLDGLDDASELIGAVNTVKKVDGRALGFNTDGKGFMANLAAHGVQAKGGRMVLLGPGGAGSAILAQAALDGVKRIDVFGRAGGASYAAACDLIGRVAAKTGCEIALYDLVAGQADLAECLQSADILVNTTPVGMGEGSTDTPVPAELLRPGLAVADAIYHPRETQLILDAKACGCTTVPGLGMLIHQAAVGEQIWYGAQMPVAEIERQVF